MFCACWNLQRTQPEELNMNELCKTRSILAYICMYFQSEKLMGVCLFKCIHLCNFVESKFVCGGNNPPSIYTIVCVCVDSSAMQLVSKLPLPCSGCLNVLGPLKIRPHQSAAPLMQGFTVSQWAACTGLSLASACPGSILFAKLGLTLKTYQNYWIFGETRNDVVEIKGHRRTYAPDSDVVHATGALQAHCAQIQPSKQVCDTGRLVSLLTATQCPMRISRLCTWHMIEDGHSAVMPSCCRLCPEACFYLHGNHIIWYQISCSTYLRNRGSYFLKVSFASFPLNLRK